MSKNFDVFKGKYYLAEANRKATEISRKQALSQNNYEFVDPHIRIMSEYPSGIVEYNILNESISSLQKIAQSAYNFAFGSRSKKGKLPTKIDNESKLLITGMVPGSFIVTFDSAVNKKIELPTESQYTLAIEKDLNIKNKKNSIDLLKEVVENLVDLSSEADAESFLLKYGDRTFRESSKFLNVIKNNNIDLDIGFGYSHNSGILKLEKTKIKDKIEYLEHKKIKTTRTIENFSGKLIAVSNPRKELTFENKKEKTVIKVIDDSLNRNEMVTNITYDFEVEIELVEDVVQSSTISKNFFIATVDGISTTT